jgi:hypothetical protein
MGNLKKDLQRIYRDKAYILLLALTAACGYGFKTAHPVMGIDDTPYAYYFEEGLAAVVGRWVLFVLNKVIHISDFAPFITDFAAVLILMLAVTVWGLLFYSVFGERIPKCGYWFFSCIFLSCPLIAEVFTYYLHNGIAIGYLSCGISLYLFREGLNQLEGRRLSQAISRWSWSVVTLVVALGCYESFMIVWLVGVMLILLSERIAGVGRAVFRSLCVAAVLALGGMVLRAVVLKIVISVFDLSYLQDEAVQRSVTELLGWMLEPGAKSEFAMIIKRLFVMYGVFGYAYYPIRIFVLAAVIIAIYSLWRSIRQRDIRIAFLMLGSFAAAFLLAVVEGKATLYRSAQFLPLICAYGVLLMAYAVSEFVSWMRAGVGRQRLRGLAAKGSSGLFVLFATVILWNQCTDLNHWFYVDYQKYEYTKEYMLRVAEELERNFDTSKPVVFTGEWENPKSLVEDAYVDYGSETFYQMKRLTDVVDEHLLEKFYRDYGVWVAQTPSLSVVSWGKYAFDNDEELVRFLSLHGHTFTPLLDSSLYPEAEQYALDLPSFPQEGSIVDVGDYIIVHF